MSRTPKRSHEDGYNSSSKHVHEDLLPYPRLMPAVSNEYHVPKMSPALRIGLLRFPEWNKEIQIGGHRCILSSPSTLDDSNVDQSLPSESRVESKDSKEGRDTWFEHGDPKVKKKESSVEPRGESQGVKNERDGKADSRSDDGRKMKYSRYSHNDTKVKRRVEVDAYPAGSSHLNWKESKDHHSGKRFSEPSSVGSDPWTAPYNSPHSQFESAKDDSTSKEWRCADAREARTTNLSYVMTSL